MNFETLKQAIEQIQKIDGILDKPESPLSLFGMPVYESKYMPTKTFHLGTWLKGYKFGRGKNRSERLQKKIIQKYTSPMTEERVVEAIMFRSPIMLGSYHYRPKDAILLIGNTI